MVQRKSRITSTGGQVSAEHSAAESSSFTRRRLIAGGLVTAGALAGSLASPGTASAVGATSTPESHPPYPIPWLDPNLHHNQVPVAGGPPTELFTHLSFQRKSRSSAADRKWNHARRQDALHREGNRLRVQRRHLPVGQRRRLPSWPTPTFDLLSTRSGPFLPAKSTTFMFRSTRPVSTGWSGCPMGFQQARCR